MVCCFLIPVLVCLISVDDSLFGGYRGFDCCVLRAFCCICLCLVLALVCKLCIWVSIFGGCGCCTVVGVVLVVLAEVAFMVVSLWVCVFGSLRWFLLVLLIVVLFFVCSFGLLILLTSVLWWVCSLC